MRYLAILPLIVAFVGVAAFAQPTLQYDLNNNATPTATPAPIEDVTWTGDSAGGPSLSPAYASRPVTTWSASPVASDGTPPVSSDADDGDNQEIIQDSAGGGRSVRIVKSPDDTGFHITAIINGKPVRALIDSGASVSVLTAGDAAKVGAKAEGHLEVTGLGGSDTYSSTHIADLQIAGVSIRNVPDVVIDETDGGESIIGLDILSRPGAHVSIDNGVMTLSMAGA